MAVPVRVFPSLSFDAKNRASGNLDIEYNGRLILDGNNQPVKGIGPQFQKTGIYFQSQYDDFEALFYWNPSSTIPAPIAGPCAKGGNVVATAVNGTALAVWRNDPGIGPRIIFQDGRPDLLGFDVPCFSDDGKHFACLRHEDGWLFLNGQPITGAYNCRLPRFGGTTLMAEIGTNGQVIGIADCNNPDTVAHPAIFGFPASNGKAMLPLMKPRPVWVAAVGQLMYVCHTNDALIMLQWAGSKGKVFARNTKGLDQGYNDARPTADGQVRAVWSENEGHPGDRTLDLNNLIDVVDEVSVSLLPPAENPPINTLPDAPWVTDPKGTKYDVRAIWRASATAEKVVGGRSFLWFRKSDGVAGDPQGAWGAWFDHTIDTDHDRPVAGLWMDSSTGQFLDADTPKPRNRWMTFQPKRLWFPLVGTSPWKQAFSTGFHWREYAADKIDPVASEMRFESGQAVMGGIAMRYRHTYDASTQDGYIEYSYYDVAMIERRWEMWKNGKLEQFTQPVPVTGKESFVAPWILPTNDILTLLEGGTMPTFPTALWAQFRLVLPPTFLSAPASEAKDNEARKYVAKFAAQCAFSLFLNGAAKNAVYSLSLYNGHAPYEVLGQLYGFDMFSGLGENVTTVNASPSAMDITGQSFVPAGTGTVPAPQDFIGAGGGGTTDPGVPNTPGTLSSGRAIFTTTGKNGIRYMTAEDGGGEQGATVPTIVNGQRVDRPAGLVAASRTQADIDRYGTGWQEWYVSPASIDNLTGVSIKCGEFYATAWGTNGKMVFNRRAIGPGEVWRLHHQDNGVALQAYNDKFVCAERDAQGNVTGEVNVNRDAPGEWETFTATGLTVGGGSSAVGGGPTAPLAYPVAIDGRFFRVPIVGASMLYAASPLIDYRAALDENQALGFNAVRLFCGQLEQVGQDVGGSLYSRLAQIARDCLDRR